MRITIRSFIPAVLFTIFATVLFCLPGSVLPGNEWFDILQVDKWVHIGLFFVLTFLWCAPVVSKPVSTSTMLLIISVALFGYGILMEFVQHFFITNRSFDVIDIAADAVGCLAGFFLTKRQWKAS